MSPAISVCISVYGLVGSLPACLHSVAFQQGLEAAGLEIIVVDDASPASCATKSQENQLSSAQIVSQFQQTSPWPVLHIQHEENCGLVEARRTAGSS